MTLYMRKQCHFSMMVHVISKVLKVPASTTCFQQLRGLLSQSHTTVSWKHVNNHTTKWNKFFPITTSHIQNCNYRHKHKNVNLNTSTGLPSTAHLSNSTKDINKSSLVLTKTAISQYSIQSDAQHFVPVDEYQAKKVEYTLKALVEAAPVKIQPYLYLERLHQPTGIWLLFLPSAWSIALATDAGCFPDVGILATFFVGSFLMRGSACIINDMLDKKYDAKVARTHTRPLVTGELSTMQALEFLSVQLSTALMILITFDYNSFLLGVSCMIPCTAYPLMKRYTYWPQLALGMTLNWGVLLGWSVVHGGSMNYAAVLPLYTACILWTMIYDTIYAHQDRADDMEIGIKSLAIKFGDDTKNWLFGFCGLMSTCWVLAGLGADQTLIYYLGVGYVSTRLAYLIKTTDLKSADDCARTFKATKWMGIIMFLAIMGATLAKTPVVKNVKPGEQNKKKQMLVQIPELLS